MQIREEAAQEWADAEHISGFEHAHCLDAQTKYPGWHLVPEKAITALHTNR